MKKFGTVALLLASSAALAAPATSHSHIQACGNDAALVEIHLADVDPTDRGAASLYSFLSPSVPADASGTVSGKGIFCWPAPQDDDDLQDCWYQVTLNDGGGQGPNTFRCEGDSRAAEGTATVSSLSSDSNHSYEYEIELEGAQARYLYEHLSVSEARVSANITVKKGPRILCSRGLSTAPGSVPVYACMTMVATDGSLSAPR